MILIDANLLLYGAFSTFSQHEQARTWLTQVFNAPYKVGLPWPSLLAFVRIATNPRVFSEPLPPERAAAQVTEWLQLSNVWTPTPTEQHGAIFTSLINTTRASGNLVSDAHLAALAIEHGLEVCSTDSDFSHFPDVRWRNPLRAAPRRRGI